MCGRFSRWTRRQDFAALAGLPIDPAMPFGETVPSWNIAPGRACALVRQELGRGPSLDNLTWGLIPHWAKARPSRRPINARIETAHELPTFRRCFRYRRCLVAADGWYEWVTTPEGKQPYFHCLRDRQPFFFGGVWDTWAGPDGEVPTFAILTQPAAHAISSIHDRMPVIVPASAYAAWLDKDVTDPMAVLAACTPPDLIAYPVSRQVNRADVDNPQLVEPLPGST